MVRTQWILCGLLLCGCGSVMAGDPDLFPFVVSYDAPANVSNVSSWLERPAGAHGFVRCEGSRFRNDAGPIRFWATNICFEGCFPTHAQAERLAARLARLGINCVRMHHMDNSAIWGKSPNKVTIDPAKLERLDNFIAQLKKHGIYVNLNLHVSRWLDEAEGFTGRSHRPDYDKGLDNFEPRMIELQKKYARDLLTHANPYTGNAYIQEPAVAFVEINNENALHATWGDGQIDRLPEPYLTTFRESWNAWLRKKYGPTERLREAWNVREVPAGPEQIRNGDFRKPLNAAWNLERDDDGQAHWSIEAADPDAGPRLRLVVNRPGSVSWHPQFNQGGIALRKDMPYTLTFRMKSDRPRRVLVNAMQAHDPWSPLGFSGTAETGPEWKAFRFVFTVDRDDSNARIGWTGLEPDRYELADVSLRTGGSLGIGPSHRLENATVPTLQKGSMNFTRAARHDFSDFLWDTEAAYWRGMYRFLKEELGLKSLVTGTQIGWSTPHLQAALDYVDGHAYWQHPVFPGRAWDPNDWYVEDRAMVNEPGGTLARLASTRVAGKAYTVSEYNHPQPLSHAAEGFPMIAAFGAFQNWSAIYSFDYTGSDHFEPEKLDGFFDIKSDPARLVHMPACAAIFLRGDVAPARETMLAPLSRESERRHLRESFNAWSLTSGGFGVASRWSLLHGLGLDVKTSQEPGAEPPLPSTSTYLSDTGQLRWDVSKPGAGYFAVDTPRTKLFTGFIRGRQFAIGDVGLRIGATRLDWATVSLTTMDGKGFDQPGRILVAATGWIQNQGAQLKHLEGKRITLGNQWGGSPILCEGVTAEIMLPVAADRVIVYPLDTAGNRRKAVPAVTPRDGSSVITIGPRHETLWYEVVIR